MRDGASVARDLTEYGNRLRLAGANPHRSKAYLRAAENLLALPVPLADVVKDDRLQDIPGVGPAIAGMIKAVRNRQPPQPGKASKRSAERSLGAGSLGPSYNYAAMLTGHELEIIDRKLDRRMKAKAARGEIPHLLIDRFQFDSFVPELEGKGSNRLLPRFGTLVYMFFLITPPKMTVERA